LNFKRVLKEKKKKGKNPHLLFGPADLLAHLSIPQQPAYPLFLFFFFEPLTR
jgi:hypothetical protein